MNIPVYTVRVKIKKIPLPKMIIPYLRRPVPEEQVAVGCFVDCEEPSITLLINTTQLSNLAQFTRWKYEYICQNNITADDISNQSIFFHLFHDFFLLFITAITAFIEKYFLFYRQSILAHLI